MTRTAGGVAADDPGVRFELAPVPPFRLDLTAWALRRRAHNALDRWDGAAYRRALRLGSRPVEVVVRQVAPVDRPRLEVALTGEGVGPEDVPAAAAAVATLLGTDRDLSGWYAIAAAHPASAGPAERLRGLKPPRFPTAYEALMNAIFCQQITLDFGLSIVNAWLERYGEAPAGSEPGVRASPSAGRLAALEPDELRPLRLSRQKARAAVEASRLAARGAFDLERLEPLPDAEAMAALTAVHGVGRWTAEYVLLRGLGRLHVLPGDDAGARNALARLLGLPRALSHADIAQAVEPWQPYAGMLYFHLLVLGLERKGLLDPT